MYDQYFDSVVVKLDQVLPGISGFNAYLKIEEVSKSSIVNADGQSVPIAEGLAGDDTGVILFRVIGPKANELQAGRVVAWRNGVSEVIQEHHRISIDKFGLITVEDVSSSP
jgi:replication factor A1